MADFGGLVTTDAAINAETRAPIVIAVAASFSFVTVTVVILRIYTRVCMIKFAGADDVAIVIAEVNKSILVPRENTLGLRGCRVDFRLGYGHWCFDGYVSGHLSPADEAMIADANLEAKHGLGKHTWTVSKDDKQIQLKVWAQ